MRNFNFNSHCSPVMACKNQPSVFLAAADFDDAAIVPIRGAEFAKLVDAIDERSRMRPSQRQGSPLRPTRSTVCQRRPSVSQGILAGCADFGDFQIAESLAWQLRRRNRADLRSTCGPAARYGPSAAAVCECIGLGCRLFAFGLPPCRDFFRRSFGHDVSAAFAGFGAQVDDPIGRFDHVEIVLDDDDGVAQIDQAMEHVEQLANIVEMQTGGRLVEQIERSAGVGPGQLGGQLDALGFAAGKRVGRLAESQIIEADVAQRLQDAADFRNVLEQLERPAARHFQHVGNRLAVISDGERFGIVAPAAAGIALDPHVGQEVHFDAHSGRCLRRLRSGRRAR